MLLLLTFDVLVLLVARDTKSVSMVFVRKLKYSKTIPIMYFEYGIGRSSRDVSVWHEEAGRGKPSSRQTIVHQIYYQVFTITSITTVAYILSWSPSKQSCYNLQGIFTLHLKKNV